MSRLCWEEWSLGDSNPELKPLFIDESPFENPPKAKERIQLVEPKMDRGSTEYKR